MSNAPAATALVEAITLAHSKLLSAPEIRQRLARLQNWQLARLQRTYADFSRQARYRDALDFFVNDLYGPNDYTQRDRDLGKVIRMLERLLSPRAVKTLMTALELEWLSQDLDLAMVECLDVDAITDGAYLEAYCRVGRRADRQRQIVLIISAGRALDEVVNNPAMGAALWAARVPARLAGVSALHDFLQRGYQVFNIMHGADEFLAAVEQRETAIMRNLFSGAAQPFDWQPSPSPTIAGA